MKYAKMKKACKLNIKKLSYLARDTLRQFKSISTSPSLLLRQPTCLVALQTWWVIESYSCRRNQKPLMPEENHFHSLKAGNKGKTTEKRKYVPFEDWSLHPDEKWRLSVNQIWWRRSPVHQANSIKPTKREALWHTAGQLCMWATENRLPRSVLP